MAISKYLTDREKKALIESTATSGQPGMVVLNPNGTSITGGGSVTSIGDGNKSVTTAGTRVTLASTTACQMVSITANLANTGVIVVGGTTVVASAGTRRGTPLNAGDTITLSISDLVSVNLDATVNGEGVTFTYLV